MALRANFQFNNDGSDGIAFEVELLSTANPGTVFSASQVQTCTWYELNQSTFARTGPSISFTPGGLIPVSGTTPFISSYSTTGDVPSAVGEYFNYRTSDESFHPTKKPGEYSFDFWPVNGGGRNGGSLLIDNIFINSLLWTQIDGTISLNPDKYCVFYDYNTPQALGYQKGGTCTLEVFDEAP